jgi:hypothetical protein
MRFLQGLIFSKLFLLCQAARIPPTAGLPAGRAAWFANGIDRESIAAQARALCGTGRRAFSTRRGDAFSARILAYGFMRLRAVVRFPQELIKWPE